VDGQTAYLVYAGTRRADPTDDAILTDYISILGNAYAAAKTADASLKAITKEIILKTFDISEQSGTINDINETSDYRLGESKLTKKGAYATLTTSPVLQSQFAVWKLSLRDATSALSTQALDVYDADGKPFITGVVSSTSVSDFYYLLPAASNATYTFLAAAADGNIYSCTTKGITLEAGKYYRSTLTLKQDLRATPLTFEANAAGATVTFNVNTNVATNPVSYRQYDSSAKAWTDWTAYTDNTPVELTNSGDKLQFKAENATYATNISYSKIKCSADCYAYGNIMSLTDGDSFSTADELTGTYTFRELFSNNSYLQIDASRPLLLPAETLKEGCYHGMFYGCSKLTVAPVLPAKTLVNNCYCEMFEGCAKLGSVTCLATNIDAANCLFQWLKGAGTDSSCERKVYVDPNMMYTTECGDVDGQWYFDSSGDGSTNTWSLAVAPHALADVTSADLGSLVGADGNIYTTASQIAAAGTTAIGVIAYLDDPTTTADDEITEKSNGGGHGLVLCLKDAASEVEWSTETSAVEFTGQEVTDNTSLMRLTNVSGYSNTMTLAAKTDAATKYPAAYQAKNYTGLTAPTGTTGWFLPSAQQWVKILQALGGLDGTTEDLTIKLSTISSESFDSNKTSVTKWENAFAKAGAGNYDDMIVKDGGIGHLFWSSSENSAEKAINLYISNSNSSSIALAAENKVSTGRKKVRPFLAF
jgi:uncharacterized protein (TIGR02145 family)